MADLDGKLILETLYSLDEPATLTTIVSTVAGSFGTEPNQVRNAIKEILEAGVEHGYVQYSRGKYYADNCAADEGGDGDIKAPIKKTGNKQPEDATRRRRRSSSRRHQRSGSRRSRSRPRRRSSSRH